MMLKSRFSVTGIGSVPYLDEKKACDVIFSKFSKIPFWPQMINKSYLEGMIIQVSERMPAVELDAGNKKVFVKKGPNIRKEIEQLNERYYSEDLEYFSMSEDYAAGFYEYLFRLKNADLSMTDFLKGQITGPVSFMFGVSDRDGVPLFFDKDLREAALKTLFMRARWQASRLKKIFKDVIIFIDEPTLAFFKHSDSDSKIKKEELLSYINRIAEAIHIEACFAGMHCCADCDWDFVLSSDVDIINFDAFNYGTDFIKNHVMISKFIERGGVLGWGMIPTTSDLTTESLDKIIGKLGSYVTSLTASGIDRRKLLSSSMITPSCGLGALSEKEAWNVIDKCSRFSQAAGEVIF